MKTCAFPVRTSPDGRCGNRVVGSRRRCHLHPFGTPIPEWFLARLVRGDEGMQTLANDLVDGVIALEALEWSPKDPHALADGRRSLPAHADSFLSRTAAVQISWPGAFLAPKDLRPVSGVEETDDVADLLATRRCLVVSRDDLAIVGVEVLVRSPTILAAFASRERATSDASWRARAALIEEALLRTSPADESSPNLLAEFVLSDSAPLVVSGTEAARGMSEFVLPAGRYCVVSWNDETGPTRFGVHLAHLCSSLDSALP